MRHDVDFVIAGGGPAGAVSAILLARAAHSVWLVEQGKAGRHKACGHCLNPTAMPLLDRLGLLADTVRLATGFTHQLALHARSISPLRVDTGARDVAGLLVERDRFDQMLRDAAGRAGAQVLHGTTVRFMDRDELGARAKLIGQHESRVVSCRLLIGADGTGSSVARRAGFAHVNRPGRKYGISFDWKANRAGDDAIEPGCVHMFLTAAGYLGAVRQAESPMHCAALISGLRVAAQRDPLRFVREAAEHHPPLRRMGLQRALRGDLLNFCATGPMPWCPHTIADASVALLGDAAGYVEPFTGEGMTWAMESALLLAESISNSGDTWNGEAAADYSHRWRERVRRRQRTCRMLTAALDRPVLARWMLRLGHVAPMLTRRLVRGVVTP
jgi:flavin-dependent dehydrogenase